MGSKSRFGGVDHSSWVHKNDSLAKAERTLEDKKSYIVNSNKEDNKTCFNCEFIKNCRTFNANKSKNVFSFGGDSNSIVCERWKKKENAIVSNKNIKKLMNEFKRGCRNGN